MTKFDKWWDNLDPHTKKYLESQPIYHDKDLVKAGLVGAGIGFFIGVIVGFEWAWRPVVDTFKPLVG